MSKFLKPVEEMGSKAGNAVDNANATMTQKMRDMGINVNNVASANQERVNSTLSDFSNGLSGAALAMTQYASTIGKARPSAEGSAKSVSDGAQNNLLFDGNALGSRSIGSYAGGIGTGRSSAASAAASVRSSATSSLNDTSTPYASGESITRSFANGLASAVSLGAVAGAMGMVNQVVRNHQPHSPAKKGVFSGSGWTSIFKSGLAITKQFASGLGSTSGLNNISSNMDRVNDFVKSAMDKMTGYLDDNMDLSPTITPVLDMSNLDSYTWNGNGLLNLATSGVNYSSLNPTTQSQSTSRYSIDEVVKGLSALDRKLETLAEVGSAGNRLLEQDRFSPVYMDKDLVNRALAPGMSNAQRIYNDRKNMLDGELPPL